MSTRLKVAILTTSLILSVAIGIGIAKLLGSDEERPPIIVRGGSIKLDNGEPNNWKPWKENGNKKSWRPDQSRGASAPSFAVTVSRATGPAAPSSPCPSLPITGTRVVIEYTTDAGVKSQVTVSLVAQGSKQLPQIDAPSDLAHNPGSGATPEQVVYDPGAGWISNVTISDAGGGQQLCGFEKAASTSGQELIRIKPNR